MKLVWKAAAGATHYLVTFSYPGGEERIEKTFTSDIHLKDLVPNSIYDIKVVGMNANTAGMPMLLKGRILTKYIFYILKQYICGKISV